VGANALQALEGVLSHCYKPLFESAEPTAWGKAEEGNKVDFLGEMDHLIHSVGEVSSRSGLCDCGEIVVVWMGDIHIYIYITCRALIYRHTPPHLPNQIKYTPNRSPKTPHNPNTQTTPTQALKSLAGGLELRKPDTRMLQELDAAVLAVVTARAKHAAAVAAVAASSSAAAGGG
jgi:hypothetical protein